MVNDRHIAHRALGSSGPRVFPLALGCMGMSGMDGPADESESLATIHAALERGVTLLDTGDFYGRGHNELLLGRALRGRRDAARVSVKFGALRSPDGGWLGIDTRPVEGELVPMALEMGLGITPWSPRRSGVLSGKYTRESAKDAKPGRGAWVQVALTERNFAVLDVVRRVAGELGTTPTRVALAWVQSRRGVASTIVGARSAAQLEDNLGALDVRLPADAVAALDEASKPALNFPADFVRGSGVFKRGGTTVNGETAPPWPLAPKTDAERY